MFIREVKPELIKDSRGELTIQFVLKTYKGKFVASAPSGKSVGEHEVPAYVGGIQKSFNLAKLFCKILKHRNFLIRRLDDLELLTKLIRKFEKKFGELGGNTTYALETVFLKAASKDNKKELWEFIHEGGKVKIPMPVGNCAGGGLHSKIAKKPDFQEFLLIPNEKTFSHAFTVNFHAYQYARKFLETRKRNDEGAWMTSKTNEEVLEIMKKTAKKYNLRIGIDAAASTFYHEGYYNYKNKRLIRDRLDQIDYIERLIKKFDLFYVEDGLQQEDFIGFREILNFVKGQKKKTLIVGDDLTVTNLKFVARAERSGSINALIVKPNQIGSILEVKKVVDFCKKKKIKMIFSHRSGETMDNALADYAVGFGADFIKAGIYGKERLVKLHRVMEIEKKIMSKKAMK